MIAYLGEKNVYLGSKSCPSFMILYHENEVSSLESFTVIRIVLDWILVRVHQEVIDFFFKSPSSAAASLRLQVPLQV